MPHVHPRTAVYGTTLTAKSHRSLKHIITTGLEPVEGACVRSGARTRPLSQCPLVQDPCLTLRALLYLSCMGSHPGVASLCVAIVHSLSPHLTMCTAGCHSPTPQA